MKKQILEKFIENYTDSSIIYHSDTIPEFTTVNCKNNTTSLVLENGKTAYGIIYDLIIDNEWSVYSKNNSISPQDDQSFLNLSNIEYKLDQKTRLKIIKRGKFGLIGKTPKLIDHDIVNSTYIMKEFLINLVESME